MNINTSIKTVPFSFFLTFALVMLAQELHVQPSYSVNTADLPEYVIITSENTKLVG